MNHTTNNNSIHQRCKDIQNGASFTQKGLSLLNTFNDSRFTIWLYNEYIPNINPEHLLLRTNFQDIDRNLIITAWHRYLRSVIIS